MGTNAWQLPQALEKVALTFSNAWKKHLVPFPILGKLRRKSRPVSVAARFAGAGRGKEMTGASQESGGTNVVQRVSMGSWAA